MKKQLPKVLTFREKIDNYFYNLTSKLMAEINYIYVAVFSTALGWHIEKQDSKTSLTLSSDELAEITEFLNENNFKSKIDVRN